MYILSEGFDLRASRSVLSLSPSLCRLSLIYAFFLLSHQAISNKDQHSISYTLSRAQTVVVEYTHDSNTDMFQVTSLCFYHQDWSFTTSYSPYFFHFTTALTPIALNRG